MRSTGVRLTVGSRRPACLCLLEENGCNLGRVYLGGGGGGVIAVLCGSYIVKGKEEISLRNTKSSDRP